MKQLLVAAGLAVTVTAACGAGDAEMKKEAAILASLHRGQSRAEFYDIAKHLGVAPRNSDYVKLAPKGPPVSNGDFPQPNASHHHPTVAMYFRRPGGTYLWKEDRVDVYFDDTDRVARWTKRTFESGV